MSAPAEILDLAIRKAAQTPYIPKIKDLFDNEDYRNLCLYFLHACLCGAGAKTLQRLADEMYDMRAKSLGLGRGSDQ